MPLPLEIAAREWPEMLVFIELNAEREKDCGQVDFIFSRFKGRCYRPGQILRSGVLAGSAETLDLYIDKPRLRKAV